MKHHSMHYAIHGVVLFTLGTICAVAFAGTTTTFSSVTNASAAIADTLKIAGASIFSVAVVVAGAKVAFASARLQDVQNLLIGGGLIGCAATLGGWLLENTKA